jgi:cobalt-precorrin-5B (C1)-methyltransferase
MLDPRVLIPTTGTCAAACAKAAALRFLGESQDVVEVTLPQGGKTRVTVATTQKGRACWAETEKPCGEAHDVTSNALIRVRFTPVPGGDILITGGTGVGKVTRPGLPLPQGAWAINPSPRRQITENLREVLPEGLGGWVEITIPRGEEIARKTCNPLLGIVGGISILGTTGFVRPISCEAFQETLRLHLHQRALLGGGVYLVFGNHGRAWARKLGFPEEATVEVGTFLGFALEVCKREGIAQVVLLGQIGKMVKVAGGIFDLHHEVADARREILFAHLVRFGLPGRFWKAVWEAKTAEEALEHLMAWERYREFFAYLAQEISQRVRTRLGGKTEVESILFSLRYGVLGRG